MDEILLLPTILLGGLSLLPAWFLRANDKPVFSGRAEDAIAESKRNSDKGIILFTIASAIIGLGLRLYGFNRSLWLDEFGTLWAIEGSMAELWQRVYDFHGQSPLYYLLVWPFFHFIGESELSMRLLSLLLGIGTACGSYLLGSLTYGRNIGLISASALWLSPTVVQLDSQARPYALALLMTAMMLYGFARAARDGDLCGRWLFVLGGVGVFYAQYLLVLPVIGCAAGYLLLARLRLYYRFRQFVLDIAVQILLASLCFPHVLALWVRRGSLSWFGRPNYLTMFELIGPFIILALTPFIARGQKFGTDFQQAIAWVLWLTMAVHAGSLYLLAYLGTNLLHTRYMVVMIIPTVVLAAAAYVRLPRYLTIGPLLYCVFFVGAYFSFNFAAFGSFSRAGFQDWKEAVYCLDQLVHQEPEALVLYRSGFVEEDQRIDGKISSVIFAPLRNSAVRPVRWNLIVLNYSWNKSWRREYFARVVEPAISRAKGFYFLTCAGCFNDATGKYPEELAAWIEESFQGRFQKRLINAARGITLVRFVDEHSAISGENFSALPFRDGLAENSSRRRYECPQPRRFS
jgi:Dolichyl-phosphate-mannose-protein mannosyltransferase